MNTNNGQRPSRLFQPRNVADSLGLYLPAAVGYRFIGLARGVILTWLLSTTEFGFFQIATVTVNILMPLAGLGLNEAMARYVPQHEARHTLRPFLRRAWRFSLGVGVLLCAICMVFAPALTRMIFATSGETSATDTTGRLGLMRWTIAGGLTLIGYVLLLAVLRGLRMFMAVSLLELSSSVAFAGFAIALPICGWPSAQAMIVAMIAAHAIVVAAFGLPFLAYLRRLPEQDQPLHPGGLLSANSGDRPAGNANSDTAGEQPGPVWVQMLRYSIWTAMAGILWQVTQFCPMWYLQKTHGPEVTAVFGSVRMVTQAVLIAATTVIVVVQAAVTRTWESQGREAADRQLSLAFKVTGLVMLAGCAVLTAGAPLVVRMFPHSYAAGAAFMPLLLVFFMIGGHLSFLIVHFVLIERPRYACAMWLVAAVFCQGFAVWLVRPGSPATEAWWAASWAGILGMSVALAVALYWLRRERRPIDVGSAVLIAVTFSLILPGYALTAALAGVAVLVAATGIILDKAEKRQVWGSATTWVARVRGWNRQT